MGDIWLPGLPPLHTNFEACLNETALRWPTRADAIIMAAVAGSESSYDMHVINDTPATGDYSCGLWQVNYYNGLYSSRAAAYGTPAQFLAKGIGGQADAAFAIWQQQGFGAWGSYTNGAWRRWLPGGQGIPGPQGPQGQFTPPAPPAPAKDWSVWVQAAGRAYHDAAGATAAFASNLSRV